MNSPDLRSSRTSSFYRLVVDPSKSNPKGLEEALLLCRLVRASFEGFDRDKVAVLVQLDSEPLLVVRSAAAMLDSINWPW